MGVTNAKFGDPKTGMATHCCHHGTPLGRRRQDPPADVSEPLQHLRVSVTMAIARIVSDVCSDEYARQTYAQKRAN